MKCIVKALILELRVRQAEACFLPRSQRLIYVPLVIRLINERVSAFEFWWFSSCYFYVGAVPNLIFSPSN